MENGFQVELSSAEISVLAALLGYESVFGIGEKPLAADADIKTLVVQNVRQLERKRLIQYDLGGALHIVPRLKAAIYCLCKADTLGLLSENLQSGRKSTIYIAVAENRVTTLKRLDTGEHLLCVAEQLSLEEILPWEFLSAQPGVLRESLLLEDAEYLHAQLEAFGFDAAETRLKKQLADTDALPLMMKLLAGKCGYLSVRSYQREKNLYRAGYHFLAVAVDHSVVSLTVDENGVVRFEEIAPLAAAAQIGAQFRPSGERGTV